MTSKRAHPRGRIRTAIRYFAWNEPHDGVVTEIGSGGLFVETESLSKEGDLLTLRVALPLGKSFTVLGRVVRTVRGGWARLRTAGMGIQFVDLSSEDRLAVLRYLGMHPALSLA